MDTKICKKCGKEYTKAKWMSKLRWTISQNCSVECGKFVKGQKAWNFGKTDYLSENAKKIISENIKRYRKNETSEQKKLRIEKSHKTIKEKNSYNRHRLGKKGNLDVNWKGESANYNSKHRWIQNNWQKTGICEFCLQERLPRKGTRLKWGTHWANKSGQYKRERNDWYELCPQCHRNYDRK